MILRQGVVDCNTRNSIIKVHARHEVLLKVCSFYKTSNKKKMFSSRLYFKLPRLFVAKMRRFIGTVFAGNNGVAELVFWQALA